MNPEHITAYALGELEGKNRLDFESELARSPELQEELRGTAALCDALSKLQPDDEDLGEDRRGALLVRCRQNLIDTRRRLFVRRTVVVTALGALAACLLLAPMLPWAMYFHHMSTPVELAESNKEEALMPTVATVPAAMDEAGKFQAPPPLVAMSPPPVLLPKADIASSVSMSSMPVDLAAAAPAMRSGDADLGGVGLAKAESNAGEIRTDKLLAGNDQLTREVASGIAEFTAGWSRGVGSGTGTGIRGRLFASEAQEAPAAVVSTESYDSVDPNRFQDARTTPLSTFSIDVDTASYANLRRMLQTDKRPPANAVRIEEMINYFSYDYPEPDGKAPFSVNLEAGRAPWASGHALVRIGLKGRALDADNRPPSNLVFLIDVSGSMQPPNKLPLLKRALRVLAENLGPEDRVAIVTYAGSSGLVLPSTAGRERERILEALSRLESGGSTNGAGGIQLAYETARQHFGKKSNNRVILCTDGDFNVGITDQSELVALIEKERESGVFLSVLGFGDGNLKDSTMEKLADKGNGNYAYIDTLSEGRKVLVEQMAGTLYAIAKDVKIQVEFNPAHVSGYRLIGYENRLLAKEDFNDDRKDAGEIGAGHTVTALYEVVPAGIALPGGVDPLKYQPTTSQPPLPADRTGELLTVKLRYKAPDGDRSELIEKTFPAGEIPEFEKTSQDFQFAAAVAAFGMKLRNDAGAQEATSWEDLLATVRRTLGTDPGSRRAELLTLIEKARILGQNP